MCTAGLNNITAISQRELMKYWKWYDESIYSYTMNNINDIPKKSINYIIVLLNYIITTYMLRLSKSQPGSFLSYHRVYNKSNTTGATSGVGATYSSKPPEFTTGWCKVQSLHFCIIFCRSVFVALSILFWSLHCLFFDLRFLITPLVCSNLSHILYTQNNKYNNILYFIL